ncbi:MAG: adenylate/guanylate cyclase domain-containing protein [Rhodospirillales bacterium]
MTWVSASDRKRSALAVGMLATVSTILFSLPVFDRFDGLDTDLLHYLSVTDTSGVTGGDASPVAVIAVTEATHRAPAFNHLPKVMWTPEIALVQEAVLEAGATVFAWDIVLPTSAAAYVADRERDKPLLKSLFQRGRKEGRIILGETRLGEEPISPHASFAHVAGGASNLRHLNVYVEPDGVVRGVPLLFQGAEDVAPRRLTGMAFEVALRHVGAELEMDTDGNVVFGDSRVPTVDGRNALVRFDTTPGAIPTYSFHDIYRCAKEGRTDYLHDAFNGRAVLFGAVLDVEDRNLTSERFARHADMAARPTPCSDAAQMTPTVVRNATPGVYVHANAVINLLSGSMIERAGRGVRVLMMFLAIAVSAFATMRWRPHRAAMVVGLEIVVIGIVAVVLFRGSYQTPLVMPIVAALTVYGVVVAYRVLIGDRARRQLHETFKRYLDPKVIDTMLESGDVPRLGGESLELTCFFSDIAKFSGISERMPPNELVRFLNTYFQIAGAAIEQEGGIIERFEGDAILAVFGAPIRHEDHATRAVRAAFRMEQSLSQADSRGAFEIPGNLPVLTRIGVNSGEMTVGNVGSERRHSYTVMGDAVNLSARLEGANKQFGTTILVGETTRVAAGDIFEWMEVDRVRVVGRAEPVRVYTPLGVPGEVDERMLRWRETYGAALEAYRDRRFDEARQAFESLAQKGFEPAAFARERCDQMIAASPPADWDGVTNLISK